jgi:hypothetical protein
LLHVHIGRSGKQCLDNDYAPFSFIIQEGHTAQSEGLHQEHGSTEYNDYLKFPRQQGG